MQHDEKSANATGIVVTGGSTARIEKCNLSGYTGDGVKVMKGSFLRASGSAVKSCARGISVFDRNSCASVESCVFDQTNTGIHAFEDAEIRVSACEFNLAHTAIEATQAKGKVHNCKFVGTTHSNILSQGASLDCANNSQSLQQKGTEQPQPAQVLTSDSEDSLSLLQQPLKFEESEPSSPLKRASCVDTLAVSTASDGISPRLARWTAGWS